MDDNTVYTFDILGTITDANQQNNITNYAIGALSGNQNVVANQDQLVTFNNVSPTGGIVTLTVTPVSGLSYINAARISTGPVPEPASLAALLAMGGLALIRRR
ncbi:MAG: PEP-CTERM sorting domain-containing protein [Phycisphaerales bacterium]|nr:PEP-CTERM sorting domain-containing protein [Phycisphaerales bacterium]